MDKPSFRFPFDAETDNTEALPYVARLSWNMTLKKIEHHLFPMNREARTQSLTHVFGEFEASPMEIIETRRGLIKRRKKSVELRSWYLVVPRGCLILIGEGEDSLAFHRIGQYLAGTLSVQQLGQHKWDFQTVESDWRAVTSQPVPGPHAPRIQVLEQRRQQLIQEIREIDHELESLRRPAGAAGQA
ncbi:MAG: hypothetical protein KJS98_18995 [Nitrospirae bacterium]|nr:hypothetical protein [Nitrospirota bacterium]MDE3039004.1 hypothetical protein [Nitrospirota bacterium]MDE3051258.1 hypothetical protein [Nitrospirota bacterium]MDE3220989.1 hypothetical protein [Nitrospirota bacterium]